MTEEFTGQVDEVEIHDHELTPERIAQITYIQRVLDTEPVAYWPGGDVLFLRDDMDGVIGG